MKHKWVQTVIRSENILNYQGLSVKLTATATMDICDICSLRRGISVSLEPWSQKYIYFLDDIRWQEKEPDCREIVMRKVLS